MLPPAIAFRVATGTDGPAIVALISRSVYGLMSGDYALEQLDAAQQHVLGVDSELGEHEGALVVATGFSPVERFEVTLPPGVSLPGVRQSRPISSSGR